MLCRIAQQQVRMVSRNAKDWTGDFPALARALALLPVDDAWLDGEVVALDAAGTHQFSGAAESAFGRRLPEPQVSGVRSALPEWLRSARRRADRAQAPVARSAVERACGDQVQRAFRRSGTQRSCRTSASSASKGWSRSAPTCPTGPAGAGVAEDQVHAAAGNGDRRLYRSGRIAPRIRCVAARRLSSRTASSPTPARSGPDSATHRSPH